MTPGYRLKTRRKELGIPVEAIANSLGVSIATIYRYENGDIEKVPSTHLEPLARILQTTPAFLMGWGTEDSLIQATKEKLSAFVQQRPTLSSGKRVKFLFDQLNYDPLIVCFNLSIDFHHYDAWINFEELPPRHIIDKILGLFLMKPEELLNTSELVTYQAEPTEHLSADPSALSLHETAVIHAYRSKPELQPAVDILLGVPSANKNSLAETSENPIPLFPDPKSPINYWDDQHVSSLKLADDSFSLGSLAEPSSDDDKSQPHE